MRTQDEDIWVRMADNINRSKSFSSHLRMRSMLSQI